MKRRSKPVLLIAQMYWPRLVYFDQLVRRLALSRQMITLTSYSRSRSVVERRNNEIVFRILPLKLQFPTMPGPLILKIICLPLVTLLRFMYRPSVLHLHAQTTLADSILGLSSAIRLPMIYDDQNATVSELLPNDWVTSYAVISPVAKAELEQRAIPESRISLLQVLNPPLSKTIRKDESGERSQFRFIYVGRLEKEKGLVELLHAFERVTQAFPSTLTIVGYGNLEKYCRDFIIVHSLQDKIHFVGEASHEEALKAIASSDALVLPSYSEGLSRVLLEAIALNVNVIASDLPVVRDLVITYDGLLCKPRSIESLERAMVEISKNTSKTEKAKTSGEFDTQLFATEKDWDFLAERFLHLYEDSERRLNSEISTTASQKN